jgi:hypothetical protein
MSTGHDLQASIFICQCRKGTTDDRVVVDVDDVDQSSQGNAEVSPLDWFKLSMFDAIVLENSPSFRYALLWASQIKQINVTLQVRAIDGQPGEVDHTPQGLVCPVCSEGITSTASL